MSKHVNGRKKVREKSPLLTKAQLSDFHKGRTDKPVFLCGRLTLSCIPFRIQDQTAILHKYKEFLYLCGKSSTSVASEGEKQVAYTFTFFCTSL